MLRRLAAYGSVATGAAVLGSSVLGAPSSPRCEGSGVQVRRGTRASQAKTLPIACRDGTSVFPWTPPPRSTQVEELKEDVFDVLVIGGGVVGSAVALEASTRGLRVALVERNDYAAGTSGRSTKLIHGGVRYLESAFWNLDYGQYKLVVEALEERSHMLTAAPYLAKALPIMVPVEDFWKVPYFYLGTKVYDLLSSGSGVPSSMLLSKKQALFSFPMLDPAKLSAALVYYDGQMNDTRYSLMILLTAVQAGATAANYTNVEKLVKNEKGEVKGAVVRDLTTNETFRVRAHCVVNATGPFSDSIRRMARSEDGTDDGVKDDDKDIIVGAGGVHIVLSDHFCPSSSMGLIVPKTSDGRVLFFLPWSGATLVGTTDSKTDITMTPKPTTEEVDFILSECSKYLNRRVSHKDVRAAWSGIRPLVKDVHGQDTKAISREHVIEKGAGNLITIGGGKWTTQRRMAEDTVDKVLEEFPKLRPRAGPSRTRGMKLVGADRAGIVCEQKFNIITVTLREDYDFDRDVAEHLVSNYGTRALQIAEIIRTGYPSRKAGLHPKRLHSKHPFLEAEVVFAVEHEYALSAVDVLARRTRLAYVDYNAATEAVPLVVNLMGMLLKWSSSKRKQETEAAMQFLDTMKAPERSQELV